MDIQGELTDEERQVVARRLLEEQRQRFGGIRKAAYTAAGVNPATWSRATTGERVRPDRLVLIVTSLWPDSRGDWANVPERPSRVDISFSPSVIVDLNESDIYRRFDELEERVRKLEDVLREGEKPGRKLSASPDRNLSAIAALEDGSIAGEQGMPEED